ncbi:MAG: tryptophan--tRNA ligase [Candidatus Aminicenantes bacterium]|nr:tryptophan--tRNA ligase [Candidatus Aminicenantes bacterium]
MKRDDKGYLTYWNDEGKIRVFSGIQPSGELHIGNLLGAISNWVTFLDDYECIFCIVDHHATTIEYDPQKMPQWIFNAAVANMAAGLDPDRCTLFVQSEVPEHTELAWIFNTVTPYGDLSRMTQFKQKSEQYRHNVNVGLFTYPVLQAADILLYKASAVPVGEDQVQHIELAREIARGFNNRFGEVFPECQAHLTQAKRIMGLDGKNKMSKSLGNAIGILEPLESIWNKLRPAKTDERRQRKKDPGNPEECNIYTSYHCYFSPEKDLEWVRKGCTQAAMGCLECKKKLLDNMDKLLSPIRKKAQKYKDDPEFVYDVLSTGAEKARGIAEQVTEEAKKVMGLIRSS